MNEWRRTPAKHLYQVSDRRILSRTQPPLLSVSIYRGVVPRADLTDKVARAEDLSNYKVCEPGDIVINRMSAYQGALGIARQRGIVSPEYIVLRTLPCVEARFLTHLFKSAWFVGQMSAVVRGIGSIEQGNVRTPRINPDDLGGIEVALPGYDEQRAIADFLDVETARIDALITKKRRLIELLDERLQSLVSSVLWDTTHERVRLRHLAGRPTSGNRDHSSFTPTDVGVPCLRGLNVRPGRLDLNNLLFISADDHARHRPTALRTGDLVIVRSGNAGAAALIPEHLDDCNCVDLVVVGRSAALVPRYLELVVNSREAQEQVATKSAGALLTHFNAVDAGDLDIPIVSLDAQAEAVSRIDSLERETIGLTSRLRRQIDLLAEHRQALITAAVTGALAVPGVAA